MLTTKDERPVTSPVKEFEFTVRYEDGADRLMDVFREYPQLHARSTACQVTRESMWRIDHLEGPQAALEALDDVYLDERRCNECLDDPGCDTYREYAVLDRDANERTVYTFRREISNCHSIPYIVVDAIGDGTVFEAVRRDGEYRWKVLYPGEQSIGELYDDIESELRDGLALELSHLKECGSWNAGSRSAARLSPRQREVLERAHEAGYYERPRAVTVAELADELDVPRSTAQYRLRSAEDRVVTSFVDDSP